jgi:hypothetical protein
MAYDRLCSVLLFFVLAKASVIVPPACLEVRRHCKVVECKLMRCEVKEQCLKGQVYKNRRRLELVTSSKAIECQNGGSLLYPVKGFVFACKRPMTSYIHSRRTVLWRTKGVNRFVAVRRDSLDSAARVMISPSSTVIMHLHSCIY